ncbi:MAG: DinB family protein [Candidatus Cloacimonetes bacterium]|nr:DinB family protein [Candidatus Cloacimonadota bacterium]
MEMTLLADQIERAFRGDSWHGPAVLEVLAGITAEDAAAHPIAGAHSIWEIVLHMASGYALVLGRIQGDRIQLEEDQEWPSVQEVRDDLWQADLARLDQLNRQLVRAVGEFSPARLGDPLGSEFTAATQFLGAPQHDLYHAGQIVMLKKALARSRQQT